MAKQKVPEVIAKIIKNGFIVFWPSYPWRNFVDIITLTNACSDQMKCKAECINLEKMEQSEFEVDATNGSQNRIIITYCDRSNSRTHPYIQGDFTVNYKSNEIKSIFWKEKSELEKLKVLR